MSASDFIEYSLVNHMLGRGQATYQANATRYILLHTGSPGEAGTANVAGNNARKGSTFTVAAAAVRAENQEDLLWNNVTSAETITYFSLWSAVSGGNCLVYGSLTAKSVLVGDNYKIPAGGIEVYMN